MLPTASRCLRRVSPIHVRCLTVDHIYNPRINSPSSQVWKFKANPRAEQQNSRALKKSSLEVSSDVRSNFARCLEAAARLKLDGTPPDLRTYSALMTSASEAGLWKYAWAILDDMLLMGIKPTVEIFNHLIHAHRHRASPVLWKALDKMNELGVQPNSVTYSFLINMFTADGNLELALRYFHEMKSLKLMPSAKSVQTLVLLAADLSLARLAIDIADWYESAATKSMGQHVWMKCLVASAQEYYGDGVTRCWKIIVGKMNLTPDEGVCLAVLNAAARHGLTDLATDVLRVLKSGGVEWQEHHFAAVVEAFCSSSQVKEAMITLSIMRNSNIPPNLKTTRPILEAISASTEELDNTWQLIDEIHEERKEVDTAALNVVLQASVLLGDLQRAMGSYKSFSEYGASPDIETFNTLLDASIASKHRQLGDTLLDEMKAAEVLPDGETFEKMIQLCLTQETYEDAFFYLEEMKAASHVPPLRTYVKIIRRCLKEGDPRFKMAVEEMGEIGYAIPDLLKRDIAKYTDGRPKNAEDIETVSPEEAYSY
ncbi:hypothetical protein AX14_010006 [Amanita brunnescens Koide BX004]|nr:hypothetical protein AX14_010006 [Amanita brunnescens Koide BX004]